MNPLDQEMSKPTYDGGCIDNYILDNLDRFSKYDKSDINDHVNRCEKCLKRANDFIKKKHEIEENEETIKRNN